jgi:hypothetical protein
MSGTVYGVTQNPGDTGRSLPAIDHVMAFGQSDGSARTFEAEGVLEPGTRGSGLRDPGLGGPFLNEGALRLSHPSAKGAILPMIPFDSGHTLRTRAGFRGGGRPRRHREKISRRVSSGHGEFPSLEVIGPLGR